MTLKTFYKYGFWDVMLRYKMAAPAAPEATPVTHPVVKGSLAPKAPSPITPPAVTPDVLKANKAPVDAAAAAAATQEKVSEELCTTCRKSKHYGPCLKPQRTRPHGEPHKSAAFNLGLTGGDPHFAGSGDAAPSTSPNYHSATSDSSLARARSARPADEQAATGFADFFRHGGINNPADEWANATGALVKTQAWNLPGSEGHSLHEQRGPTVNPYEERRTTMSTPLGWGDEGKQRITRAFDQIDNVPDTSSIEGPWGSPVS